MPQARQILRALLADKIEMEPVVEDGRRGYLCRGVLQIDPLLADLGITSLTVVAPTGFEPVFPCRRTLLPANQRLTAC
jgi:hypothetical protein